MYPFAASTHDYRCSHTMGVENFGWLHLVIREYSKDTWIGSLLIKGRENDTYRWKRYGIFHPKQTFVYAIYWRWYSIDLLLHNWFSLSLSLSQGKVPLLSLEALHQLHIFIFVLALVHVIFCVSTMFLGGVRVIYWCL